MLVSPESDSSRGVAAAAALVRPLQQRFGAASIGAGGLSLYWSGSLAWQSGGLGFAVAFSRDSGVVYQAEVEGDPVERVRYGDDQRGLVGIAYRLRPGIGDWEFGNLDADDVTTSTAATCRCNTALQTTLGTDLSQTVRMDKGLRNSSSRLQWRR